MSRDPDLEARMTKDFGHPPALLGKAMFGAWCFLLNGNMLGAARDGRAMYHVGIGAQAHALAEPRTEPMSLAGRPRPGFIWLSGPPLADDAIRQRLARMALSHVSTFPPKDC